MTGYIIILIAGVYFLVRSTLESQTKKQIHSVFIKILLNHMQMIFITSSFDLDWPDAVINFLNSLAIIVEA